MLGYANLGGDSGRFKSSQVIILQIKQRAPAKATRQNDRQKARVQLLLMSMKPPESPPVFGTGWADLPWADLGIWADRRGVAPDKC